MPISPLVCSRHEREREDIELYIRAYLRDPEAPQELGWVEETAAAVLEEYPWSPESGGRAESEVGGTSRIWQTWR